MMLKQNLTITFIIQVTARLKEIMYNELAFYEQDEIFTDGQNSYTFMLHNMAIFEKKSS